MEEASKANLCRKSNLQCLKLDWIKDGNELDDTEYNDEDVMEGLKPHSNLEVLTIAYYKGKKFASWMMMMRNLVKIKLHECNRCEAIPPLGYLPKLREIEIEGMKKIKVIGQEFYGIQIRDDEGASSSSSSYLSGTVAAEKTMFQSCRKLTLRSMPALVEWLAPVRSTDDEDQGTTMVFPNLEELCIMECPKLTRIPSNCFPSLKVLIIRNVNSCRILETMSRKLRSLTILRLDNVGGGEADSISSSGSSSSHMNCIVEEVSRNNSESLSHLYFEKCQGLTRINIGNTNLALKVLDVEDCPNLCSISLPEDCSCIKYLSVRECPSLASLSGLLYSRNLSGKKQPQISEPQKKKKKKFRGQSKGVYGMDVPLRRIDLSKSEIRDNEAKKTLLAIIRANWPIGCFNWTDISKGYPNWLDVVVKEFYHYYKHLGGQD